SFFHYSFFCVSVFSILLHGHHTHSHSFPTRRSSDLASTMRTPAPSRPALNTRFLAATGSTGSAMVSKNSPDLLPKSWLIRLAATPACPAIARNDEAAYPRSENRVRAAA